MKRIRKRKPAPPLERDFQKAIVELAQWNQWDVSWTHDSRHSPAGWPDLVLMRPPVILFRECKRDARPSRVTDDQRRKLGLLRACGLDAGVWTPDDWDEIVKILTARRTPMGRR